MKSTREREREAYRAGRMNGISRTQRWQTTKMGSRMGIEVNNSDGQAIPRTEGTIKTQIEAMSKKTKTREDKTIRSEEQN